MDAEFEGPPPFCPNPGCSFHVTCGPGWRWQRAGFFSRQRAPYRVQRFRCCDCGRYFSTQTFVATYWLKRPDLFADLFQRLVGCSGYRQIARCLKVSPQTVLTQAARLGRHCLLFHELTRPKGPLKEPVALDGFESFEFSQFHPTRFHVVAGKDSHYFYGFTATELRRSGRMTAAQKKKREKIEMRLGRPDPGASERDVATILRLVTRESPSFELHTDEHTDYPRALKRLRVAATHRTISSRASRTPQNPLWPINLLDLLIRHSGANHKRETIAHSKRRQSAIERLLIFLVWRNHLKWFSEQKHTATPAMMLGIAQKRLSVGELLKKRLFVSQVGLPDCWAPYYFRLVRTREIPNNHEHRLRYAC
jgi:transposase-like protein